MSSRQSKERTKIETTAARVGLLAEGRVVDEALRTDRITLGRSAADLADPALGFRMPHRLLRRHRHGWRLDAPATARLRLERDGVSLDGAALVDRGLARHRRGGLRVELRPGDRVRLGIDGAVVLAQIVTAPVVAPRRLPMELRAGPLAALARVADLSPAVLVIMALVATAQIGTVIWLERFVPPPERALDMTAAVDRFRDIVAPADVVVPDVVDAPAADATPGTSGPAPTAAPEPPTLAAAPRDRTDDRAAEPAPAPSSTDDDALLLEPTTATFATTALASALRASDQGTAAFAPHTERSSSLRAADIISQQTARGADTGSAPSLASAGPGIAAPTRVGIERGTSRLDVDVAPAPTPEAPMVPPPTVSLRPGRIEQAGRADADETEGLARDLDRNQRDLDRCYTRLTQAQGGQLAGRLVLQVEVAPDGQVTRVNIADNQLGGDMATCVESSARRWRFRRDGDGSTVTLRRAYVFAVDS